MITSTKSNLKTVAWFIFRITILNLIIVAVVYLLAILHNIVEPPSEIGLRFSFSVYLATLILTNLVYFIGISFELIHSKLWNNPINFKEIEMKFFKAGLLMILIINIAVVIIYLIKHFE